MDWNQPINNLKTWPFEPTKESTCFPRGSLEWVIETKNVNGSYIFDLCFEIACRWQNNSLCQRNMCPGYCMQSFIQKNIMWWNILLSGKMFTLKNVKFCASSNLLFFTSCWLAHNQLSWNVLLVSCDLIGQLCLSGPGYSTKMHCN